MGKPSFGALLAVVVFVSTSTVLAQDTAAPVQASHRVRVSGGVMQANLLHTVPPRYPQDAKEQHVSGSVVLSAVIGADGVVEELTAMSGPDSLRAVALESARQWTYKPYILNGVPTEVQTTITINFALSQ